MKRKYGKPVAKKVTFNFEQVVAQSAQCGSGIVLTHQPGTECTDMTPDKQYGVLSAAWSPDPKVCGFQKYPVA